MLYTFTPCFGVALNELRPEFTKKISGFSRRSLIYFSLTSEDGARTIYASKVQGCGVDAIVCLALLVQMTGPEDPSTATLLRVALKLYKYRAESARDQMVSRQLECHHARKTLEYEPVFSGYLAKVATPPSIGVSKHVSSGLGSLPVRFQQFMIMEHLGLDLYYYFTLSSKSLLGSRALINKFIDITRLAIMLMNDKGFLFSDVKPANFLTSVRGVKVCDLSALLPFGVRPKNKNGFTITPAFMTRLFMLQHANFSAGEHWQAIPSELVSVSRYALMFFCLAVGYSRSTYRRFNRTIVKKDLLPPYVGKRYAVDLYGINGQYGYVPPLFNALVRALGYAVDSKHRISTFDGLLRTLIDVRDVGYRDVPVLYNEGEAEKAGCFDRAKYFDEEGYPRFGRGRKGDSSSAVIPDFSIETNGSVCGAGSGSGDGASASVGSSADPRAGAGGGSSVDDSCSAVAASGSGGLTDFFASSKFSGLATVDPAAEERKAEPSVPTVSGAPGPS